MLSWFVCENEFSRVHRIVLSGFALPFLGLSLLWLRRRGFEGSQIQRMFLALVAAHASALLLYDFVYPFTVLLYLKYFLYQAIQVCYLNNILFQRFANDQARQAQLEKLLFALIILDLLVFLSAVFRIRSSNQCGQNLLFPRLLQEGALSLFVAAALAEKIRNDLRDLEQIRRGDARSPEEKLIQTEETFFREVGQTKWIRDEVWKAGLLLMCFAFGGILRVSLQLLMLRGVASGGLCGAFAAGRSLGYLLLVSGLDGVGQFLVDFGIGWEMTRRIPSKGTGVEISELFGSARSLLLNEGKP